MDTQALFSDETVQSLVELGRQTAGPQTVQQVEGIPVPFIINDGEVTLLPHLKFNEHAERPERVKANVGVLDPESFIEYWNLFSDANSRVFAYEPEMKVIAVLDYHLASQGSARWGQHRVTLTLRASEEWKVWVGRNNKQFSQMEFSEFLEQNSIDITNPSPAAMMEIARDLEGTKEVEFGGGAKTGSGQVRFKYTETVKATVGAGALEVPEQFTIQLPVFIGGPRIPLQALLRYRVKEGKLILWYTLVRPEEAVRSAFLAARNYIAETLSITIINGVPQ